MNNFPNDLTDKSDTASVYSFNWIVRSMGSTRLGASGTL